MCLQLGHVLHLTSTESVYSTFLFISSPAFYLSLENKKKNYFSVKYIGPIMRQLMLVSQKRNKCHKN